MNRTEIIAANPIEQVIAAAGVELKRKGKELSACCPFHDDSTPSFSVNVDKGTWYCHGCGKGGGVIDFVMLSRGIDLAEAMRQLSGDAPQSPRKPPPAPAKPAAARKHAEPLGPVECRYLYHDALGNVVYYIERHKDPKTFRPWQPRNGEWVKGLEGVERVLYNLPAVMAAERVFLVAGEKDADTLNALGYCATTNVSGEKSWLEGYAEYLCDKDVIVIPDNDEAGTEWAETVLKSLENKAKVTRLARIPPPHNDTTEYTDDISTDDAARAAVDGLVDGAQVFTRGLRIPIYNTAESEVKYRQFVRSAAGKELDLSLWLDGLRGDVRPMWPGETVAIVGDTGIGKTAIMHGIAMCVKHLPVLIFELELPEEMMFERIAALTSGKSGRELQQIYRTDESVTLAGSEHIWTCPLSGLSVPQIAGYIGQAELKIGAKPAVVCVDYIGLVRGIGKRYERVSDIAQDLKVLAKTSRTVIVEVSQIHRKPGQAGMPIGLHDAKDSGEVENSAGLVLGCWRDREHKDIGYIKVLKCTKGIAGRTVKVKIDFPRITQLEPDYKIES